MRIVSTLLAIILACAGIATANTSATAADTQATRLAIVFPLTVPPQSTGLIPADSLERYTSPTGVLTRKLNAVEGKRVTIGVDPMIIASIRILGNTAPPSAISWLDRLAAVPNETFALSYADSDVAALSQAGSAGILGPTSFQIDPGRYPVVPEGDGSQDDGTQTDDAGQDGEDTPPPPSPAPQQGGVPSSETLLDWPYTTAGIVWPRSSAVTESDLVTFNTPEPVTTLLGSDNLASSSRAAATVDGHSVLVADEELSALLAAAITAPDALEWQNAVDQLAGGLDGRSGTTVLTVDRALPGTATRLAETLATVTAFEGVTGTDLAEAKGEPAGDARIVDRPVDAASISRIRLMLAAEALVVPFSSVLLDPTVLTGERRLSLLALASNSWVDSATVWVTNVEDWLARSNEIVTSVQLSESSTLTFVQDRGNLPIWVSNTLDHPVTVYVTVRSATGILVVTDSRVPISIEAGSQARANIPVQSIANGEATLRVSLSSETAVPVGTPKTVTANVVAGWENTATFVIAALLIVLFVAGVVRTVLKSRRARAAAGAGPAAPDETGTDE